MPEDGRQKGKMNIYSIGNVGSSYRTKYLMTDGGKSGQPAFNLEFPDNETADRKRTLTCLHVVTGETVRISVNQSDPESMIAEIKAKDGSISEKVIDTSEVDPRNASFVEMLALSSSFMESGKMSGVPGIFASEVCAAILGTDYDINKKYDFAAMMKQEMDNLMKYGYMDTYAKNKPEYDLVTEVTSQNKKDISNYKNVAGSSSVGKGQPINVNDAKPTEVGDYKIRYTDDGYLDIRSKTSGEGFRWKLASNNVQVDSETGLKFLINDLGSGFFNMLPVDAEMEEALKQSLGVDKLETSELKGFTVHQDNKTGIHFITANGLEGQGGQIVMNDYARSKLDGLADEYLRQYPNLIKDRNEAWFYASFEVRGMVQRTSGGIMMIGPNSISYRNENGEDRWTSTFDNASWSKIKSLFDGYARNEEAGEWMFWNRIFMKNNIGANLIKADNIES